MDDFTLALYKPSRQQLLHAATPVLSARQLSGLLNTALLPILVFNLVLQGLITRWNVQLCEHPVRPNNRGLGLNADQ